MSTPTVNTEGFNMGRAVRLNPEDPNFVLLYDGIFSAWVVFSGSVRLGAWYNTYKEHGQYMLGTEINRRW